MKTIFIVTLALIAARAGRAQSIAGDWQGTLKIDTVELRLAFHIAETGKGGFTGTMDSIDQAAKGIRLSSITLRNADLKITVDAVHGTYEGKLSADGKSIDGEWSQGQPLPLRLTRGTIAVKESKPGKPSDIDGAWAGTLDVGVMKLRLVFHITNTTDGLSATMDSPDQGAKGIPATAVKRDGSDLTIEMKNIGGVYAAKIAPDLNSIEGIWTQSGNSTPLVVKRSKGGAELERRRPQNPVKPYPYREEEVAYENKTGGFKLAATLTLPQGKGPFPAAVLITGSGPQDRDEALMGHRPFLVLADHLTRKGIAVLRADDRGVAQSGGTFATATTADFATDAEAALAYLKTRTEIDPHKLGLIGHSEGGVIGPMVAARNPDVAFVVMMAGTGVPGDKLLVAQVEALTEASGKSPEVVRKAGETEREVLALGMSEKDDAVLTHKLRALSSKPTSDAEIAGQIKQLRAPWFQYFLTYDPAPTLAKVKCPVLALFGEKDRQVPPQQNLPAVRKALEAGGNKNFTAEVLPGLNHLFQTAKTGAVGEYAEIEETIAPAALEKMSSWILQQTHAL
jgi:dienelactone hydrolase